MASQDTSTGIKSLIGRKFAGHTSDTTPIGDIIDTLEFESINFFLITSVVQNNTSVQLEIEDSDVGDLSGFNASAVVVSDDFLTIPIADTFIDTLDTAISIGYVGKKRFVRGNLIVLSAGQTIETGSIVTLQKANSRPVE